MKQDGYEDEPRDPANSLLRICELQATWTVGMLERTLLRSFFHR